MTFQDAIIYCLQGGTVLEDGQEITRVVYDKGGPAIGSNGLPMATLLLGGQRFVVMEG